MASAARRTVAAVAVLGVVGLGTSGCSNSASTTTTTVGSSVASPGSGAPAASPRVDLIDDAIAALEAEVGAPQQYFEINATAQLVNLFVALNDGTKVQPWVYVDGDLSSTEPTDAKGFTFAKEALDFDPDKVLSRLEAELPQSTPDFFVIDAGAAGAVRYSVRVSSEQGGELVVVVGPDGAVKSVDT